MPKLHARNEIVSPSDPAEPEPQPEPELPPVNRKAELESAVATARAKASELRWQSNELKQRASEIDSKLSEAEGQTREAEEKLLAEFPPAPPPIPPFEAMMDENLPGAERYTYRERQQLLNMVWAGLRAPQPPRNDLPDPPMPTVRETREHDPVFGRPGPAMVKTAKPHYDKYDFRNGLEDHA